MHCKSTFSAVVWFVMSQLRLARVINNASNASDCVISNYKKIKSFWGFRPGGQGVTFRDPAAQRFHLHSLKLMMWVFLYAAVPSLELLHGHICTSL